MKDRIRDRRREEGPRLGGYLFTFRSCGDVLRIRIRKANAKLYKCLGHLPELPNQFHRLHFRLSAL